jgi:Holliday junction resolvase RusA-like endonuclease
MARKPLLPTNSIRANTAAKIDESKTPPIGAGLTLPYPPSANNYFRPILIKGQARMGTTNEATKYRRLVKEALDTQWLYQPYTRDQKLKVTIRVYPPSLRGDVTNVPKVLLDVLQGIVYVDDYCIMDMRVFHVNVDKVTPRVFVEIERVELAS